MISSIEYLVYFYVILGMNLKSSSLGCIHMFGKLFGFKVLVQLSHPIICFITGSKIQGFLFTETNHLLIQHHFLGKFLIKSSPFYKLGRLDLHVVLKNF